MEANVDLAAGVGALVVEIEGVKAAIVVAVGEAAAATMFLVEEELMEAVEEPHL